jgi:UDP-N-acetylmuramate--alanine ligase
MITYGIESDADLVAKDIRCEGSRMRYRAVSSSKEIPALDVTLNLPGVHNVLNSLAVIAVGREVGATDAAIGKALAEFSGVGRRFQRYGDVAIAGGGHFTLVDDYGHHPAEMAATLAAARGAFPGRRILLAFQPHRYTRTRDLFEDFVRVLSNADELVLADVYSAGEAPIVAADGRSLARAIRVAGKVEPLFVEGPNEMRAAVLGRVKDGDVVITMGAGSIGTLAAELSVPAAAADRAISAARRT